MLIANTSDMKMETLFHMGLQWIQVMNELEIMSDFSP